ncbi:MAG: hypothetical protein SOX92_00050 [Candidatus Onthovivens sp.]|nr:hypothetical protein [Candidatus Onthovivens sp.]
MKKKISIYLTQNIFIIVLVFFLSWGLSFLITRDIYSIKDKEKVEIFFDTSSINVEFKNKIEEKMNNDKILSFNIYDNKGNYTFEKIYDKYPKCDIFILSSYLIENSNLKELTFNYFAPFNDNILAKFNNKYEKYNSNDLTYGVKIYKENDINYNKGFNLNLKIDVNLDYSYYLFINYSSKIFSLNNNDSSLGFDVISFLEE